MLNLDKSGFIKFVFIVVTYSIENEIIANNVQRFNYEYGRYLKNGVNEFTNFCFVSLNIKNLEF